MDPGRSNFIRLPILPRIMSSQRNRQRLLSLTSVLFQLILAFFNNISILFTIKCRIYLEHAIKERCIP